jgi:predicted Zn-dependent protease
MAQERLGQARAAMKQEDYDVAAQFADEAQLAGDLAQAKTRLGKARERVDARSRENAQLRSDLSIPAEAKQEGFQQ